MVIMLLLLACQGVPSGPAATASPGDPAAELSAAAWLTRASLDLRGVRPSPEDLEAVLDDPLVADDLVDDYARDERFGQTVALHYATVLQARADIGDHQDANYRFADVTAVLTAMGEEPLRLVQHIADQDLPWTDVTTAAYTVVDPILAAHYPVDWPADATGWTAVAWTDGRPAAGLLATNGYHWRYPSAGINDNRGRTNGITRALLCQDYLDRAVPPPADLDLTDEAAVDEALVTVDSCIACHHAIDPIGAFMWGFHRQEPYALPDLVSYNPQDEWLWEYTDVEPGFYGVPGDDLADLGWMIADDSRLVSCAVQRAVEAAWGRPPELADTTRLTELREAFLSGDMTLRPLYRAAVDTPEYRALPGEDDAIGWKLAPPDLLVTQIEGLTGFRATTDQLDLWSTDADGLRSLAGAGRSYSAKAASAASPTAQIVQARLAEAAAAWVVGQGRDDPQAELLLGDLDVDRAAPADLDARVQHLWLAVLSQHRQIDAPDIVDTVALWQALVDAGTPPAQAWAAVITALLRHPDLLVY